MNENILVLVRATPEKSSNHGHLVCVAGINENREWRRLYPIEFSYGEKSINFSKIDMIGVTLAMPDNDKRKESRKVIKHINLNSKLSNDDVREWISPLVTSIEKLDEEKASLGVIKPELLDVEIKIHSTEIHDKQAYFSMAGDYLREGREKVKMPIEFRYIFKCKDEPECKGHKIILIDWELNELARNVMRKDKDPEVIKDKIKKKLFDDMKKKDFHFIMGTHFRFGTWIIIGIFYPPQPEKSIQKTLFDI